MDPALIAKYPFLKAGRELLKDAPVNEHSLKLAKERIIAALEKRRPEDKAANAKEKTASFALAKCLFAAIHDRFSAKKWGNWEAAAMATQFAEEDSIAFEKIAKELFPSLSSNAAKKEYAVDVFDYLRYGRNLVSENLEKGKVSFDREGLLHLLKNAIAERLSDIEAINAKQLPKEIADAAKDLEANPAFKEMTKASIAGFKGSYLSLPCMQSIMRGVDEGKRYYGAMTLAAACFKDRLSIEQAMEVMNNYVANCQKATHPFTPREAMNVLEWVYKRGSAGFSCKRLRDEGLAVEELCSTCVRRKGGGRGYA